MAKNLSLNPADHVSVRQRGKKWSYRFETASIDGVRKREERGGFESRDAALIAGVEAYTLYMSGGMPSQDTTMSFADFLDLWYEKTRLSARNNTLELREKNIRLHIKPALGKYRLTAIRPAMIDQFVRDKRQEGYSYETVSRMLSNINSALEYAVWPMEMLQSNPARRIRVPGKEFAPLSRREPRRRIEDKELRQIFERYPFGNTFHMPFLLGLYFGARIGEALGLSWDTCDVDHLTVAFHQQLQRLSMRGHHSFHYICEPKTEGSLRILSFDEQVIAPLLKRWRQQQAKNELFYGGDYFYNYLVPAKDYQGRPIQKIVSLEKAYRAPGKRIDLVCTQPNGKYIKPCTLAHQCKKIRDMGIHGFDFHCLRHTNLTMLGESQVSPNDIMARAGHTDYETTLQYIDNRPGMQKVPVRLITREIKKVLRLPATGDNRGQGTDGGQKGFSGDEKSREA